MQFGAGRSSASPPHHHGNHSNHNHINHVNHVNHSHHNHNLNGSDDEAPPASMPLHVHQAFQYYRKGPDIEESSGLGPLHLRIPHHGPLHGTSLSPNFMKEANVGIIGPDGFQRENCILELRKEKSRDAARSRRGKENYEFYELAKMLPLPSAITSQLDKASIIRLTISYLKLKDFSGHGDPPWNPSLGSNSNNKSLKGSSVRSRTLTTVALEIFEQHQGTHILQSLDGFAFALASDGRFLYISETVSIYLGLSQVELTGSSVFDYIHQQDHVELAEQLGISLSQGQPLPSPTSVLSDDGPSSPASLMTMTNSAFKGLDRAFCIRMKSTLTKRGCHFKSSGYRVVLVLCHLRPQYTFSHSRKHPPTVLGMVALAIALPPPSVNEVRLESDMFVTRLTFDFKIAHCEPRVADLLDYTADELTGKNMYALCHGEDMSKLRKCHVDLIHKGQVMSSYYRVINKSGGYTWVQMCATVVCNTKNSEEQSIICVNYVLSGIEHEHCIMDCSQLGTHGQNLKPDDPSNDFPESGSPDNDDGKGKGCNGRLNPIINGLDPRNADSTTGSPRNDDEKPPEGGGERLTQLSGAHKPQPPASLGMTPTRSSKKEAIAVRIPSDVLPNAASDSDEDEAEMRNRRKRRRYREREEEEEELDEEEEEEEEEPDEGGGDSGSGADEAPSASRNSKRESRERRRSRSPDPPSSPRSCEGAKERATPPGDEHRPWGGAEGAEGEFVDDMGNASVKDLEDAMNKHLPLLSKELGAGKQQQRPTIQWIGAQQGVSATPLPASTLLRQLYANRESVIRSNVHASRPAFFPGDLPASPGGSEAAAAAFSGPEHHGQFVLPPKPDFVLGAGYPPSGPAAPVGYGDSYNAMTPPSSVSPRDKLHPAGFPDPGPMYADIRHFGAADAPPHLQQLPLKPQAYTVVHSGLEPMPFPAHAQQTLGGDPGQQFYAHPGSGFHIYHPTANKLAAAPAYAAENLKNGGAGWYPPGNS